VIGDVADLADLPIEERLARGGITAEQGAMLRALDARIVDDATTASTAIVERIARWLAAGQPVADLGRLLYSGDDDVRVVLVQTIARIPPWVQWHAVEAVEWLEVSRSAAGWCGRAPARRDPEGDVMHRIVLSGVVSDEDLPGLIGHELGHSVHRKVEPEPRWTLPPMPRVERLARTILVGRGLGIDEEQIARMEAGLEDLCDRTAVAWGLMRAIRTHEQMCRARAKVYEAAELVPSIERACAIGETP
jgi:hypothetical protein